MSDEIKTASPLGFSSLGTRKTGRKFPGEQEGSLKLALRSVSDENLVDLSEQNLKTLLGPLLKAKQEDITPAKRGIQIIRGLQ